MKVFVINPGSTSTKIALFEDENCSFFKNVSHDAMVLKTFSSISDQLEYRKNTILALLDENHISLTGTDAFVGRGGSVCPLESGIYEVDELLLEHTRIAVGGVQHPANLGVQIADEFRKEYGGMCFTVNPPQVDEYAELARITGIVGVYRASHLHALNLKETGIRHSDLHNQKYEECNYIICHIGGGISVSAHQKGKMIDGNDIVGGDGPLAPTRCGSVPVFEVLKYAKENGIDSTIDLCTKNGGFVSHLGTSDAIEVTKRSKAGDKKAELIWNTMIYQINKYIGEMSVVLNGKVDGILLSGGMVHSQDLVEQITNACSWIAPVSAYPGEFEMEALSAGAIRVLTGKEEVKKYTGEPVWTPN